MKIAELHVVTDLWKEAMIVLILHKYIHVQIFFNVMKKIIISILCTPSGIRTHNEWK